MEKYIDFQGLLATLWIWVSLIGAYLAYLNVERNVGFAILPESLKQESDWSLN